jgi:hypothetical protein
LLFVILMPAFSAASPLQFDKNAAKEHINQWLSSELDKLMQSPDIEVVSVSEEELNQLKIVGPDNIDVLIDAISTNEGRILSTPLLQAIKSLASESNRSLIISRLAAEPHLSEIILEKDWYKQAEVELLDIAQKTPKKLPSEGIICIAYLKKPANYLLLNQIIGNSDNPVNLHNSIIKIDPNIDLTNSISIAWNRKD